MAIAAEGRSLAKVVEDLFEANTAQLLMPIAISSKLTIAIREYFIFIQSLAGNSVRFRSRNKLHADSV